MMRVALAAMIATSLVSTSFAAPKNRAARRKFDKGIEAYKKKNFEAARSAFAASAKIEPEVETLFAWAQTERLLGNCEKAIALYDLLLEMDMPAANKNAIAPKLDECKKIIAAKTPAPPDVKPDAKPDEKPDTKPDEGPDKPDPKPDEVVDIPQPETTPPKPPPPPDGLKHPVGVALIGSGLLGLGVGSYFLYAGRNADRDAKAATNYFDYLRLKEKSEDNGRAGVFAASIGGGLIVAGAIWYAMRGGREEEMQFTGFVSPEGGGLLARGNF